MNEWNPQANEIFSEALKYASEHERNAFVDDACGGDTELNRTVQALLSGHFQAGSFMDANSPITSTSYQRPNNSGVSGE